MTIEVQLKWELNDPLKLTVFLFGFVMAGLAFMKDTLSMGATGMLEPFNVESAVYYSRTLPRLALPIVSKEAYSILALVSVMLSSIAVRGEMDSYVALTVYSLPLRKWKLFLTKFVSVFVLAAMSFVLPYFLALRYTLSGSPTLFEGILGDGVWFHLTLFLLISVFYVTSVSLFVALLSPNSFASMLAGLAILYAPIILGISTLPPFRISSAMSSYLTAAAYGLNYSGNPYGDVILVGFFVPCLLLAAAIILSERRDAR